MKDILDDSQAQTPQTLRRVDFGNRLVAYLIDAIISFLFIFIIGYMAAAVGVGRLNKATDGISALTGMFSIFENLIWGFIIGGVLYSLIEGFTGASLGKMMMGFKIGTTDGRIASTSTYFIRTGIKNFSIVFSIAGILTYNPTFFNLGQLYTVFLLVSCLFALGEGSLALHDKMLGTAVYKKTELERANS